MIKTIKISSLVISTATFALFTWLWWQRANMPYNEAGRYYDGLVVWHEQSVFIYALLSILSFFILVFTGYLIRRK